jgi:hypothetical protein
MDLQQVAHKRHKTNVPDKTGVARTLPTKPQRRQLPDNLGGVELQGVADGKKHQPPRKSALRLDYQRRCASKTNPIKSLQYKKLQ